MRLGDSAGGHRGPARQGLSGVPADSVQEASDIQLVLGVEMAAQTRCVSMQVDFDVAVPAGVNLRGLTVSGNIEATNVQSDVFATTVSGNIDITTTGIAEAVAVSGSIDVVVGEADWDQDLAFTAVSGSVVVRVPSNTNASVTATTISGTVTTDFPLGGTARNRSGNIGQGGPRLIMTAVSGNVRLRSGPAA